ncbi:cytochrome P450 [Spirillospora sp. NPDC047279]|uniref:cytochrome P450 n=1 Tax=Spirillospora sp. NPDC047279 TaxID=3155478 RepID=UPI0034108180
MPKAMSAIPTVPGRLPMLGHMTPFKRRPLEFVQSLRSHGDLVRIYLGRTPVYVANSPEAIHRIFVAEQRHLNNGRIFDKARQVFGNGIPFSDGSFYVRQRRIMQPAFHRQRVEQYAEIMRAEATAKAESWTAGQVVDLHSEMRELVIDTVAKTLFSSELGREAVRELKRSIPILLGGIVSRTLSPAELLNRLPVGKSRRIDEAKERLRRVIGEVIREYRANPGDRNDLLSMLLLSHDDTTGEGMTDDQLHDEIIGITVSGTETATLSLSWLFHEMSRHPDVEKRVYAEIDSVLGDQTVGFEHVAALEYTHRVITEILRLHHPLWMLMRRAHSTVELAGVQLPPGTEVMFSPYALHRDPVLYPDPHRFDPDRWLNGGYEDAPPGTFIPFGLGRRQCIGEAFGWAEVTIGTAEIVRRWRLRPVAGRKVREVALATVHPSELPMVIEPRDGSGKSPSASS